jgi:hypothetical protein
MDPTITYLFNPKRNTTIKPVQEFDETYKERILELTSSMFDKNTECVLRDSFYRYIHDCIHHLKQKDLEQKEKEKEILPINGDQFIFAPKKIDVLVKKNKKNMFLIHGKTGNMFSATKKE